MTKEERANYEEGVNEILRSGDATAFLEDALAENNAKLVDLLRREQEWYQYAATKLTPGDEKLIATGYMTDLFAANRKALVTKKRKLERYLRVALNRPALATGKEQFDLDLLRTVPISLIIETQPHRTTQNKETYLCPFHAERTPSFAVFLKDNHFHCFGCNVHGDVITFTQKLHNYSFYDACKHLQTLA